MLIPSLLLASLAAAASYSPEPARAALRQHAQEAYNSVSNACGIPLEPAKASSISAGLDAGDRSGALARASAIALDDGARARVAALDAATAAPALETPRREAAGPLKAARERWSALSEELVSQRKRREALPDEKKKPAPFGDLDKAAASLRSADTALRPAEAAFDALEGRGDELREARRDALRPHAELSMNALAAAGRSDELSAAVADAKPALSALGTEPVVESRRRASVKLDAAREAARQLFENADRASNRADEFRRYSQAFDRAAAEFAADKAAALAGPGKAKPSLDEADAALAPGRK